jgi:membrane-bound lytic murein transglycosylase C
LLLSTPVARRLYVTFGLATMLTLAAAPCQSLANDPQSESVLRMLVARKWGAERVELPNAIRWVHYENNLSERWIVDFESGSVALEALWPPTTKSDDALVQNAMVCAISNLYVNAPIAPEAILQEQPTNANAFLFQGQLTEAETQQPVTLQTVNAYAGHLVTRNGMTSEYIRSKDGKMRMLVRLQFQLDPDHLAVRARKFYPLVRVVATRFQQPPELIMAMIHTESAFNPQAASHARAYGLMQVVPSTGGREANQWLNEVDEEPSLEMLLTSSENIILGTAYLALLLEKTFSEVENPTSRLYCAVAAYNGGSSSVARTFTQQHSVRLALKAINGCSPNEVLMKLTTEAPNEETQDYVRHVFQRILLYRPPAWIATDPR